MTTLPADAAISRGDLMRRAADIETQLRALQTARRLESASVGRGGLRLFAGGSMLVEDGGHVTVSGGGDIEVSGGGDIEVSGGGDIEVSGGDINVNDGGALRARYPSGRSSAVFGPLSRDGVVDSHGLAILDDTGAGDENSILTVWRDLATGVSSVVIGEPANPAGTPVDVFHATVSGTAVLDCVDNGFFLSGGQLQLTGTGGGFFTSDGQLQLISGVNQIFVTSGTTASAANVVLGSANAIIQRSTSARRYKADIRDFHVDPRAVLDLRPRTFRDAGEVAADPQVDRWHVGFVAEEVDAVGLSPFVDYTADGEPEAVTYDRLAVALVEVCQWQQKQIDKLTQRIADLEVAGGRASVAEVTVPAPTELPKRRTRPVEPVQMEPPH